MVSPRITLIAFGSERSPVRTKYGALVSNGVLVSLFTWQGTLHGWGERDRPLSDRPLSRYDSPFFSSRFSPS